MNASHDIQYVSRKNIDTKKWDACIHLIYGRSYYLDLMTDHQWDALIAGDYTAVMPLPWKKKWGIRYLYQPAFTQQLGIFSTDETSPQLVEAFLCELRRHFRFAEIFLNYHNACRSLKPCTNLVLALDAPYGQLAANYRQDLQNNLKKAGRSSLHYIQDPPLTQTLTLFQQYYSRELPHLQQKEYDRFAALCVVLEKMKQMKLRAITDDSGQLLATALLPVDNGRLYLLQSTNSPAGRRSAANHLLLDRIIAELAGQPLILDFEGSEQPGIAHFYRNFGAIDQPYFFYYHNRLPWPLRYLKPEPATSPL